MASRLSEQSLVQTYDQGHKSFYVEGLNSNAGAKESPLESVVKNLLGPPLNLDELVNCEDPYQAVEAIEPQDLYHALMRKGPEDCIEVLPYISQEQLIKIFDYDVWHEDELSSEKIVRWLELYGEVGAEELTRRFQSLDEQYQTAFLAPYIELVELEEYEKLSDANQDRFQALPCGQLFYALKTDQPRLVAGIERLIQSMLTVDINYLYSLLNHSFHLPQGEQELVLKQMRRARLEEDGFVTFQESYEYFVPLSINEQKQYLPRIIIPLAGDLRSFSLGEDLVQSGSCKNFMEKIVDQLDPGERDQVRRQLLVLANALCSATHVEPDDLKGAEMILAHGQAMVSLALEWIGDGDPHKAKHFLLSVGPKIIFRVGLTLVHQYVVMVLESLKAMGFVGAERVFKYYQQRKFGLCLSQVESQWIDLLGMERTEWLKGLLNRFPLHLTQKVIEEKPTRSRQGARVEDRIPDLEFQEAKTASSLIFESIESLKILSAVALDVEAFIENLHHAIYVDKTLGRGQPVDRHHIQLDPTDSQSGI